MDIESISTARLVGVRPTADHATVLSELYVDERVAAALWPGDLGGARTPEQAADLLERYMSHWDTHGFGPWLFFERDGRRFAGRGGLLHAAVGGASEVEVLYAVPSLLWGQGYATEMAVASVDVALRKLQLPSVVAFTLVDNLASRCVMEHAGLKYEYEIVHAGLPHALYRRVSEIR